MSAGRHRRYARAVGTVQQPEPGAPSGAPRRWVAAASSALRRLPRTWGRWDGFTRARLTIVASWAALSIVTLWATCAPAGRTSALGAEVELNRESLLGVQLLVRNESRQIWEDVVFTVDGSWQYRQRTMRPHDRIVLSMDSFRGETGALPREYDPRELVVTCSEGSDRFELR